MYVAHSPLSVELLLVTEALDPMVPVHPHHGTDMQSLALQGWLEGTLSRDGGLGGW